MHAIMINFFSEESLPSHMEHESREYFNVDRDLIYCLRAGEEFIFKLKNPHKKYKELWNKKKEQVQKLRDERNSLPKRERKHYI